jgi:predicted adenine nucleotide alpha hydrolase (AANH) superfamily ATPase
MAMKKRSGKKILLHTCCAPCTTYVHKDLVKNGYDVTGYFYCPNIHPYTEFDRRLTTLKLYALENDLKMIYDDKYDIGNFFEAVYKKGEMRCLYCYIMRLHKTAKLAKEKGFDCFSTTLLISPHQKHELVCEAGNIVAKKIGIPFLYKDYRPHYKDSVQTAKAMNLYRQKYCGCVFSERDRFQLNK